MTEDTKHPGTGHQTYCYVCDERGDLIYADSFAHRDCEEVVDIIRNQIEKQAQGAGSYLIPCTHGSLELHNIVKGGKRNLVCLYHANISSDDHNRLTELVERNVELLNVIEASNDGMVIADGTGRYTYCNSSYRRISGLAWHEVVGHTADESVRLGAITNTITPAVLKTGKAFSSSQTFRTGVTTTISGSPLFDAKGRIHRVIINVRDTTELEQLRAELSASRDKISMFTEVIESLQGQRSSLLFASPAMCAVRAEAIKFAKVDAPLLIMGETGSGKEVVADVVHKLSPRKARPFLKINCAAIPEQLLESELFGHEEGAFTSAKKGGRIGLLEMADGGTVFLDEIDALSYDLQAKLLRFLQKQEFYRVGGNRLIRVNVRLIAATNRNLEDMNSQRAFRTDFFYRLYVLTISVPPLRERAEDIIALTRMFLARCNEKYQTDKELDPLVYRRLLDYAWPGNVRELENLIERLVVVSDGRLIRCEHLPLHFIRQEQPASGDAEERSYRLERERFERNFWGDIVRSHRTTRAMAQAAGVTHSTVVKRMQQLGLTRAIA